MSESVSAAQKAAEEVVSLFFGTTGMIDMNKLTAIISAACSPVAPEPSRPGRTKLLMKFWSAMHLAGFAKDKEWDAQEKIHIKDLAQLMTGAAPAVTPRCPKCSSVNLGEIKQRDNAGYGLASYIDCQDCKAEFWLVEIEDAAQFFQPPAQPRLIELRRFIERASTVAEAFSVPRMDRPSEVTAAFADIKRHLAEAKREIAQMLPVASPQGESK